MKNRVLRGLLLSVLVFLPGVLAGGCGQDPAQDAVQTGAMQAGSGKEDAPETEESAGAPESAGTQAGSTGNSGQGQEEETDEEIDEETREELTAQMLEENDMDTSVVDGAKATKGCSFAVPEDFTELEDVPGMYVTERYPIDASTIYYVEMDKDISLQLMTEESFIEQTENNFKGAYGMDVEVELESFERTTIDGYPAFRIVCSYVLDGVRMKQLEYVINADTSYVITYSQTDDYDRVEEFEVSASTIQLEY